MRPEHEALFSEWQIKELLSALDTSVLNIRLARVMLRASLVQQRELAAARRVCEAAEGWLLGLLEGEAKDTPLREAVVAYRAVRGGDVMDETDDLPLSELPRARVPIRGLSKREVEKLARD